ncbi:hypothetical protein L1887_56598 [Cichorium endivia]|nr:hypothetical protein L1887_56598 [Cichorium endivia]
MRAFARPAHGKCALIDTGSLRNEPDRQGCAHLNGFHTLLHPTGRTVSAASQYEATPNLALRAGRGIKRSDRSASSLHRICIVGQPTKYLRSPIFQTRVAVAALCTSPSLERI